MLVSGAESFLATWEWEPKAETRSIRPAETGPAATNANNTAMTATDSYAARVAVNREGCQGNAGDDAFDQYGEKFANGQRGSHWPRSFPTASEERAA